MDQDQLVRCILGILQRGITEARSCALLGENQKAADLLDALDNLPRHAAQPNGSSEQQVRQQLGAFDAQYPEHQTRYLHLLEHQTD